MSPYIGQQEMTDKADRIAVAVLDANDLTLRGVRAGIASDDRFRITAATSDFDDLPSLAAALSVTDVALVDPVRQGQVLETCLPFLLGKVPLVIVYSDYFEPRFFLSALLSRVSGYLSKSATNLSRLCDVLSMVVRNRLLVVDQFYAEYFWSRPAERVMLFAPGDDFGGLTPRQREIVDLLYAGRTDGEIAIQLGVSLSTVQTHILNLEKKLGATSRFDLAVRAIRTGTINLSERILGV